MNFKKLTIPELKEKDINNEELVRFYLDTIEGEDSEWQSFLTVFKEEALEKASSAEEEMVLPIAIKDNILIKNKKTTAGSQILKNYVAPYNATVISRLEKAGAIFLGKTNMDEFAMGSSTENSSFQITRNPVDKERVPGGSSGGSAAAVASGEALASLGSDTGGSVRQPASFCGIVGFKPSYGAVSRYGLISFGSSLDQIGPLTKTVSGAQYIFNIIKGVNENDLTTREIKENEWTDIEWKNLTIGVPKEYFQKEVDEKIRKKVKAVIKKAKESGAKSKEISLPNTKNGLPAYYIIAPSEASSNLARYDGIRYGERSAAKYLKDIYKKTRDEHLGVEVKRRIMIGTHALSSGYYDAYYKKAQKVRQLIKNEFKKAFQEVDVLFTPTTPHLPFKIGENLKPLQMYLSDLLTVPASLAGLPALSVPVGKVENLPVGLQVIGPDLSDNLVLEVGKKVEKIL